MRKSWSFSSGPRCQIEFSKPALGQWLPIFLLLLLGCSSATTVPETDARPDQLPPKNHALAWCESRVLTVCQPGGPSDPLCRLVESDAPEDSGSIGRFLEKIEDLDHQTKNDLICARLFGRKKIEELLLWPFWKKSPSDPTEEGYEKTHFEITGGHRFYGKYYHGRRGYAREMLWDIDFVDPQFSDLVDKQILLRDLKSDTDGRFEVTLEGIIVGVDVLFVTSFTGNKKNSRWPAQVKITVEDATISRIRNSSGEGTLKEVLLATSKKLTSTYDQYMNDDAN